MCVLLITRLLRGVGTWARKPVNHTSWVALVTPTDRPKSVCNCCLIELFCGVVCVVTLPLWHFCWYSGFCHRTGSDLLLFVFQNTTSPKSKFCTWDWPKTLKTFHPLFIVYLNWARYTQRFYLYSIDKGRLGDNSKLNSYPTLKPHSYGENMLTCANLHMSRFAHVSKSKFAMRSDESYVPWTNTWNIIFEIRKQTASDLWIFAEIGCVLTFWVYRSAGGCSRLRSRN